MSLLDDGTQMASNIANQAGSTAITIVFKIAALTAATAPKILQQALAKARETHTNQPGKVSVPKLQKLSGGDIHHQQIDPEVRRTLSKELKDLGVNFSIHKAPDGNLYVSFAGRDLPSLEHGLTQTEKRLDAKLKPNQSRNSSVLQRIKARAKTLAKTPTPKAATKTVGSR